MTATACSALWVVESGRPSAWSAATAAALTRCARRASGGTRIVVDIGQQQQAPVGELVGVGIAILLLTAGVLILLIFALPVTHLRLGQPDDGNQPQSKTQRVAYDQLSAAFGPGSNGPLLLAVDTPKADAATAGQLAQLRQAVQRTDGVTTVTPAMPSADGEMATITVIPDSSPQDRRTSELLETLRGDVIPAATQGTPLKGYVGGNTAGFEDFSDKVASRLPLILIDVLIVRLIIAPAVVMLLGDRAWWLPGWLDRLLPDVSLEGHLVEGIDGDDPAERAKRPGEPVGQNA